MTEQEAQDAASGLMEEIDCITTGFQRQAMIDRLARLLMAEAQGGEVHDYLVSVNPDNALLSVLEACIQQRAIENQLRAEPATAVNVCRFCHGKGGFDSAEDSHKCAWCNGSGKYHEPTVRAEVLSLITKRQTAEAELATVKASHEAAAEAAFKAHCEVMNERDKLQTENLALREVAKAAKAFSDSRPNGLWKLHDDLKEALSALPKGLL